MSHSFCSNCGHESVTRFCSNCGHQSENFDMPSGIDIKQTKNNRIYYLSLFTTIIIFSVFTYPLLSEYLADEDSDGIRDAKDNCPLFSNSDQINSDLDTMGDACDTDDDEDGWSDLLEIDCDTDSLNPNSIPIDTDKDNICDIIDVDDDNDGVDDYVDAFPLDSNEFEDTDNDGIGDFEDIDDDNDGFSDEIEIRCGSPPKDTAWVPADYDEDSICNNIDNDVDGDTIINLNDFCEYGEKNWISTIENDWDRDGCHDDIEDDNDDNDEWLDKYEWADYGHGWLYINSDYFSINYSQSYDADGSAPDVVVTSLVKWFNFYPQNGCDTEIIGNDYSLTSSEPFSLTGTYLVWYENYIRIPDNTELLCIQIQLNEESDNGSRTIGYNNFWSTVLTPFEPFSIPDLNQITESSDSTTISYWDGSRDRVWTSSYEFDARDDPTYDMSVAVDFNIQLQNYYY